MAINVSQSFHRTSANPVDDTLTLSKAEMLAVNDNLMPNKYMTVCQDDGKIYVYDKTNTSDAETGKFRKYGEEAMPAADMEEVMKPLPSYSGGSANPTGTIISFMGVYAPQGYLKCDGTIYNIADYQRLADFFKAQFGSANKFGGDGTTTFAVPSLGGEFLRGAGTNTHTNQGNGSSAGTHQDATEEATVRVWNVSTTQGQLIAEVRNTTSGTWGTSTEKVDKWLPNEKPRRFINVGTSTIENLSEQNNFGVYSSRPTNTSVLFCIKD